MKGTIGDILPIIDDIVKVYAEHRNTIGTLFGGLSLDRAGEIISMIKGLIKR